MARKWFLGRKRFHEPLLPRAPEKDAAAAGAAGPPGLGPGWGPLRVAPAARAPPPGRRGRPLPLRAGGPEPAPGTPVVRGHDGDVQRHAYLQDVITQVSQVPERPRVAAFGCHVAGCQQEFGSLEAYEHHYRSLHTHVCSVCRRSFPSARLLDVHILEWHDSLFQLLAERQSMHQCLVEGCPDKFRSSRERKEHLVRAHRYPPDFRFDQPRKARGPSRPAAGALGAAGEEAMEVCLGEAPPPPLPTGSERRTYSHRIPSTICFGQGATRGFKNAKKRSDH